MHHYTWQWSYTVEALAILLGLFLVLSLVLLILSALSQHREHQTGRVIHMSERDIDLERMSKQGLERARSRQYHIKGRE